jgi:hypothetical protein
VSGKLKEKPKDQSTKAQRSWLSNFLGIKLPWEDDDEPEVETPVVEPSDPRAVKAANDLINVHGEAVKLGFDLGGQRDTLKTQVQQQILDKHYDDAQEGIETLRGLLDQAKEAQAKQLAQEKKAWETCGFAAAAKDLETLANDHDPRAGALDGERKRIEAMAGKQDYRQAIDAAPDFIKAVKARRDLYPARKDWLAGADARKGALVQADEAISWGADLATAKQRLGAMETEGSDDTNNYAALTREANDLIKQIGEAHAKAKEAREKWLAAAATLGTVEKQVALLETAKTTDAATHKEALAKVKELATKLNFAEALKELEKLASLVDKAAKNGQAKIDYEAERGKLSDDEAAVMRIKDTPGNLKTLKDAFIGSKTKTEESVGKNEYEAALTSLTKLKQDLKAALGAKRTALEQDTTLKVQGIKGKLGATTSGGKEAWEDIGSPEWKDAVDDILKVQLDEDFTAGYDKICDKVADDLAKDEDVKEAFKDWKKWTKDPQALIANKAKIEKAMKKVLKIQSDALGLPPTKVQTYSNPSNPGDCGGWSGKDDRININLNSADFDDFKELLDTLTHENTHAYQEKLIKDFRDGNIPPGDPNYNAAMVLEMNDSDGYVSPGESKEFRKLDNTKNPYMDQVCEKHAWRAGRMAGQAAFNKLSGI